MKTVKELIAEKSKMVVASYPTTGINLQDLIDITIELCEDDGRKPAPQTVKSVVKHSGLYKSKGRYYPENGQRAEGKQTA